MSTPNDLEFISNKEKSCPVNEQKTRQKPSHQARKNKAHWESWLHTQERTHVVEEKSIIEAAIRRHRHYTSACVTSTPPSTTTEKSKYQGGLRRERHIERVCARHKDTTSECVCVCLREKPVDRLRSRSRCHPGPASVGRGEGARDT